MHFIMAGRCGLGGELQWRRNFEAWEWEQQEHRELDAATKSIAASPAARKSARSKTAKPAPLSEIGQWSSPDAHL
jgi:hypothetical protein